jgi:hypothetical protein
VGGKLSSLPDFCSADWKACTASTKSSHARRPRQEFSPSKGVGTFMPLHFPSARWCGKTRGFWRATAEFLFAKKTESARV